MDYIYKYKKYEHKYSKLIGGKQLPNIDYPINDSYENVLEPVWKNIIGNYINDFIDEKYENLSNDDIKIFNNFIDIFISQYEYDVVIEKFREISNKLSNGIKQQFAEITNRCIRDVNEIYHNLKGNNMIEKFPYTNLDIGRIENKKMFISNRTIQEFSNSPDYFDAIYGLLAEDTNISNTDKINIKNNFIQSFNLSDYEKFIITKNLSHNDDIYIIIIETLLNNERMCKDNKYDLTIYQIDKNDTQTMINEKTMKIILISFKILGKIFGVLANTIFYKKHSMFNKYDIKLEDNPIKVFLILSGIFTPSHDDPPDFFNKITNLFQKIFLGLISHGLSPSDMGSRLVSSVRPSFNFALISSLCFLSGKFHGGATGESTIMIRNYINASYEKFPSLRDNFERVILLPDFYNFVSEYVNNLFASNKIFGFGHRIHKNPEQSEHCVDPRGIFILNEINKIFVNNPKLTLINKFADTLREKKPTLGCNVDYTLAIISNLLDIPINTANGIFILSRTAGFCNRIIKELKCKANARRPPLPIVLPYIQLK
jgi:citrate synthase